MERIKTFVGTRYDAKVVDALIRGCDAGEIGKGIVKFLNENKDTAGLVNNRAAPPRKPELEIRPEPVTEEILTLT